MNGNDDYSEDGLGQTLISSLSFLKTLPESPLLSVKDRLRSTLDGLERAQQLDTVVWLIRRGQVHNEYVVELVAEAWNYAQQHSL